MRNLAKVSWVLGAAALALTPAMGFAAASAAGPALSGGPSSSRGAPAPTCPPSDLPPEVARLAKPGQCFARLILAPRFETHSEQVLVSPATQRSETIPEVVEWRHMRVLVTPERTQVISIPATYRTVVETQVLVPASVQRRVIPARYQTVTQQELDVPAHTEWVLDPQATELARQAARRGARSEGYLSWPDKSAAPSMGDEGSALQGDEVYCLVAVPATYRRVERQVMVEPERVVETPVPAQTRQVERQVLDQPARTETRTVPAVYRTERKPVVIAPARTQVVQVPAVYRQEQRTRQISEGGPVWREIICGPKATARVVAKVQAALNGLGYDAGRVDGVLGTQTLVAVSQYQHDSGLAEGGLSIETARKLNALD